MSPYLLTTLEQSLEFRQFSPIGRNPSTSPIPKDNRTLMSYLKKTNRSYYPSGYSVIYWVIYFELYFWVYILSYIFQNINLLSENKLKKDLTCIIIGYNISQDQ